MTHISLTRSLSSIVNKNRRFVLFRDTYFPDTSCQKLTEADNDCRLPAFNKKHMDTRVSAGALGGQ